MPRDGNGNMVRNNGFNTGTTLWNQDKAGGINITATRHDSHDQDLANELTNSLPRDGQAAPTANLPMGGYRHTGAGNAQARTDYASAGQVQDGSMIWGGTSTGTANTYVVTVSPSGLVLTAGQQFRFKSHQANTGAATLSINGTSKALTRPGAAAMTGGEIANGGIIEVVYDGTQFQLTSAGPLNVPVTVPDFLAVTGSPITGNGTLALAGAAQSGNKFVASPADGSSGAMASRVMVSADMPTATAAAKGAVQLATAAEINTGTDASKGITPAALAGAGVLPKGILVFDGTPGTPTVVSASGIAAGATLSKSAAGQIAVTLATARSAAKAPIIVSAATQNAGSAGIMQSPAPTTTTFTVYTTTVSGSSIFYQDSNFVTVAIY